jgi:hypothetical protein
MVDWYMRCNDHELTIWAPIAKICLLIMFGLRLNGCL